MFKNNFVFDAISDAISKVIAEKIDPSVKTTDALQGPVPGGNDNGIRKPKVKLAAEEVEELDELSKGTLKSYAKKASSSTDERSASNLASRAAAKLAVDDPDDDGEKDDRKSFHRSRGISRAIDRLAKEEVEDIDESIDKLFSNLPKTKAGYDYKDKKRDERDAEHEKQDPKMAKHYAKNMVDTAKAAKKAKERGIKKDANDFGWQVRNGVQRGKLPEEVEPIDEAQEIHGVYKGPGNTMAFHNKNYKEPGVKHEILWHDGNKVTHTSKHDSTEDVHKTLTDNKYVKEDKDTETKDASGKVTSWSHESDWKKSTGKQGQGKVKHLSDLARRKTAKLATEEVEELDEISKKTLGSYVKKATKDARIHGMIATDFEHRAKASRKPSYKETAKNISDKYISRAWKREAGIGKAVDKLTKEENEE